MKHRVIVMPIGSEKTLITVENKRKLISENELPKTLVLVPTKEVQTQWMRRLSKYMLYPWDQWDNGVYSIYIFTYSYALKHLELFWDRFLFIVFDECHHVSTRQLMKIGFKLRAIYRLGLTVTPKRSDENDELLYWIIGKVLAKVSIGEVGKRKLVCNFDYYRIKVSLSEGELEKYKEALKVESKARRITELTRVAWRLVKRMVDFKISE